MSKVFDVANTKLAGQPAKYLLLQIRLTFFLDVRQQSQLATLTECTYITSFTCQSRLVLYDLQIISQRKCYLMHTHTQTHTQKKWWVVGGGRGQGAGINCMFQIISLTLLQCTCQLLLRANHMTFYTMI